MKIRLLVFSSIVFLAATLISCTQEELNSVLNDQTYLQTGLRSLLKVSSDTSVKKLSKVDGYFNDALVKVLLPPDAQDLRQGLRLAGQDQLIADLELRLNRAAEAAAVKATPIFVRAITDVTFKDALNIVNGTVDTAATQYLRTSTSLNLYNAFYPQVDTILGQPLVGGISAKTTWSNIIGIYDVVRTSPANLLFGLKPVNSNLSQYVTQKALDGLFIKIRDQEIRIRKDVGQRVTPEIQKLWTR